MKIFKLLPVLLSFLFVGNSFSQKIKVTSGKLSNLSGVTDVSIVYDYSEIAVGKFDKEQDYLDKRSAEMNEEEAGKGDNWVEYWNNAKEEKYQRRFEELFAKYSKKIKVSDAEHGVLMTVKTTFIEPGFNVGVMRKPAMCNYSVSFTKGGEELASITITGSPGNAAAGYDFDSILRIQESYAKAGKEFGKFLTSKVK